MTEESGQGDQQWPTPSFDRPDAMYECDDCGTVVSPSRGDKQAALLIAGATIKLCDSCATARRPRRSD